MELRDLRYFEVVAERLNIARAAEALDMSSTALGKSLRRLEKSVGAKLVERAAKGVVLTPVGTELLARIGPLQAMLGDVRRQAADLARGEAGHVKVGVNFGVGEDALADACVALSNQAKNVTLIITRAVHSDLARELRKGALDFFLSGYRALTEEFSCEGLFDMQDVVFASANHPLAKRHNLTLRDLAGWRWARPTLPNSSQWPILTQAFERQGLPVPSIALTTESRSVELSAVAYSDYLSLATREYVRHAARRYPLVELPVKELKSVRTMSIISRKGAYVAPAARRLIEILREQAQAASSTAGASTSVRKRR